MVYDDTIMWRLLYTYLWPWWTIDTLAIIYVITLILLVWSDRKRKDK